MNIEGQFAPSVSEQKYTFELQSRGGVVAGAPLTDNDGRPLSVAAIAARAATQPATVIVSSAALGPSVTGSLDRKSGEVTAALHDFKFGKDIRSMLPAQVREWWDAHQLEGAVDIPIFAYVPPREGEEAKYRVETSFKGVALTVEPEEWMSREEIQTQVWAGQAFDTLRAVGLNSHGVVDRVAGLLQPAPIKLEKVRGNFAFTESGVLLKEVVGTLENNEFVIDGRIDGYSPVSPARIRISSTHTEIPRQPRYINSMPRQVRELYEHLRPNGVCSLQMLIDRPAFGGRLEVAGSVNITDGNFVFDKFPYPVSHATGMIVFGYDPRSDMDQVKLIDLKASARRAGRTRNRSSSCTG
jgi:hypothetical protein